ncbi:CASP-like protein [Quillaja saponaria]|uniref:CASP-like protein n=1 Tax=Quillaja saponaria TaxID=32244 RepID=A0AAD7KU42_QUISA|nr:CASP-like protein [Quillaja saponaria]
MKKTSSINSESSSHSHIDSPHSPLRYHSPFQSDQGDPPETPPYASPESSPEKQPDNSKAVIVAVDKYTQYSPVLSPLPTNEHQKTPESVPPAKSPSSVVVFNRSTREEPPPSVTKVGPVSGGGSGIGGQVGGRGRSRPMSSVVGRSRKEDMVRKAALGFRVSELVLCLISFSVMAADKTQGWSGDSFDRYKEYRYCLSVNIIGFVYSGFQAYDLAYHLVSGKHIIRHHLRYHFDFFMDQILAYLLISASSSAATRVDDWQSNWGKDEFTVKASASVAMAFLAFIAFAFSSLISGYNLCTHSF